MTIAAVCLRRVGEDIQVLLVKMTISNVWTYPHGWQKGAETPLGTALRELEIQTGWTGKGASGLVYRLHGFDAEIQGYALVIDAKQVGVGEPGRHPSWFNLPQAALKLQENRTHEEAMGLILALRQAVKWYSAN